MYKLRKRVFILLLTGLTCTNVTGQTKPSSADLVLKNALTVASRNHKNVFVIFHASWCGWCRKMENAMNDGRLKAFFDNNYVIVHLTVDESKDKKELENPGADELRKKYYGDHQGLPYWFILDSKGNLIADSRLKNSADGGENNIGCPAEKEEVDYFVKALKKSSSLNDGQLSVIQERFLKNKE